MFVVNSPPLLLICRQNFGVDFLKPKHDCTLEKDLFDFLYKYPCLTGILLPLPTSPLSLSPPRPPFLSSFLPPLPGVKRLLLLLFFLTLVGVEEGVGSSPMASVSLLSPEIIKIILMLFKFYGDFFY